jgi:hypothetical protein
MTREGSSGGRDGRESNVVSVGTDVNLSGVPTNARALVRVAARDSFK